MHVLVFEEALILLEDGVAGLGEDLDQGGFVELVEDAHDGQAADKLGNEAELDEVLGLGLAEELGVALGADGDGCLGLAFGVGFEAEGLLADAAADDLLDADEGSAADEEDVGGVNSGKFLVRMLAAALRWNVGDGALEDLEQGLLDAFAGDIAGDGGVLVLAADLVDFVDVDDAGLGAGYVAVGGLEQLEDDVLDVFADVAGLGQGGCVNDGEGHVEHLGEGMGQQGLAGAGGADEQDVGLGELDLVVARVIHLDALVVVVDGNGELLLGLVLADDVLVEEGLDVLRLGQVGWRSSRMSFAAIVLEDRVADADAFIADVRARIIAR